MQIIQVSMLLTETKEAKEERRDIHVIWLLSTCCCHKEYFVYKRVPLQSKWQLSTVSVLKTY